MEVKNRIVMAPMGLNSANSDGTIDDDEIAYFEERAKGGTGMIIMGCQFLTKELAQGSLEGYLDSPHVIPQLTNLCESVQRHGTKLCAQLSCGTGKDVGVDAFDIDSGSYESVDYIFPPAYLGDACMEDVCEATRKAVTVPIMNAGNHTPETAVRLLESGNSDFVMMGRPLIAEPDMANKLLEGRREEVRPCIRCNDDCIGRILTRLTKISCSVNPLAGFERRFEIEPASSPKHVVVIGGGPGGMEAARTAAMRGHKVDLYEMAGDLGGQLKSAATPPFKSQLRELVVWHKHQLKMYGVNVHLNTKMTADSQELAQADKIIIATGAVPMTPNIKGIEHTVDIISAHLDESKLKGDKIIYCGGGLSACDSALETAMKGKKVAIIEMLDEVASTDHFINKASLIPMMLNNGVDIHTGHKVIEILEDGVKAQAKDGTEVFIKGDTIVASFGMIKNNDLATTISSKYHNKTTVIGDSSKVGKVGGAVRTGMYAAMTI